MLSKRVYETMNFKRGQNPQDTLNIGHDRYTRDAYLWTSRKDDEIVYYITFPHISKSGEIDMARIENGQTVIVTNPADVTHININWRSPYDSDVEIKEILLQYTQENFKELLKTVNDNT